MSSAEATVPASAGARQLLVSGAKFSVGPLTRAIGTVALLPLTTRVLAPDALGLVSTAQVVTNVLLAVATLGLHSAAMREYFGDAGSGSDGVSLARSLTLAAITATAVAAGLAHLSGPVWSQALSGIPYGPVLILAVVAIIPMSAHLGGSNLLRAQERALPFGIAAVTATLGGQCLGIVFARARGGSATDYLIGVTLGFTIGALVSVGAIGRSARFPSRAQLRSGLALGLPTVAHSLGIFLLQVGDRLVINDKLGLAAVGRYQVAYLIGSAGILLIIALNAAWTPMVFRVGDDTERWRFLSSTTGLVHRLVGLSVAGLLILTPIVLRLAAPGDYEPDDLVSVVLLVAPSATFYVTFQASSMVLVQIRRTRALGLVSISSAILNVGLNLAFVNWWGLNGAAVATTISYAIWGLAVRFVANRAVLVRWLDAEFAGSLVLIASSAAASYALGDSGVALACRLAIASALGIAFVRAVLAQR